MIKIRLKEGQNNKKKYFLLYLGSMKKILKYRGWKHWLANLKNRVLFWRINSTSLNTMWLRLTNQVNRSLCLRNKLPSINQLLVPKIWNLIRKVKRFMNFWEEFLCLRSKSHLSEDLQIKRSASLNNIFRDLSMNKKIPRSQGKIWMLKNLA